MRKLFKTGQDGDILKGTEVETDLTSCSSEEGPIVSGGAQAEVVVTRVEGKQLQTAHCYVFVFTFLQIT